MQFYIFFGVITAVGVGANGWVPNTTIIQQRFKERRGLAMGVISSGVGFGILVCVPLVQLLITRLGWRTTYRTMAFSIPLIIASMAILFLKRPPTTLCRHTEALRSVMKDPSIIEKERTSQSWTVLQAITTKHFWLLSLFFFLGTLITQSILTHHIAFFVDQGLETLLASYIAGMVGITSMGGKILWGSLSDKIGREMTYTIGVACTVCGITFLIAFHILSSPSFPYFYAFFFGMGYAVSATLAPLITADFFEGRAYGSIFGTLSILNGVGGAFGAWFAGFLYDRARSYVPFFIIMIACALFACLIIWIAAPRKISTVPGKKILRLKRSEVVESSKRYHS
jgi:MFS family permease